MSEVDMRAGPVVAIACAVLSALGCAQSSLRRMCDAPSSTPVASPRAAQSALQAPASRIDGTRNDLFVPPTVMPAFGPPPRSPADVAELQSYLRNIQRRVLAKWRSPADPRQSVVLEFQIAADGCVSYAELVSESERAIGAGVLKTLIRTAPFDPPPRGLVSEILVATFTARSN